MVGVFECWKRGWRAKEVEEGIEKSIRRGGRLIGASRNGTIRRKYQ